MVVMPHTSENVSQASKQREQVTIKPNVTFAFAGFLIVFLLTLKDGSSIFLQNIGLCPGYMAL
jgi:hypothetical protein